MPALVTAIGLVFAVLTERIRWAVAFKTVVFLPMAISAFATGVTWRIMYQQDPGLGAINALGKTVSGVFSPAGVLSTASAVDSRAAVLGRRARAQDADASGRRRAARADRHRSRPGAEERVQAVTPAAKPGDVVGTVWRDFKPGGGKAGVVEKGELGLPGVTVELRERGRKDGAVDEVEGRRLVRLLQGPGRDVPRRDRRADVREAVRRLRVARART